MKSNKNHDLNKSIKLKFRHKHPIIYIFLISSILFSLSIVTFVLSYTNHVISKTPIITEKQLKSESTSNMYDIEGHLIWSDTENRRDYIKINDVPKSYIELLLSVEDSYFYEQEYGLSKTGIMNAFITPVLNKFIPSIQARGGSTIDQQLIKNSSPEILNQSTIDRKIMEWWKAYQLNKNFTKDQILEYYINKIYLGEFSYGADTISVTYYGKHLNEFAEKTPENLSKLAIIAGLGQSPSSYNLYDNPELVEKRRAEVILSAVNSGYLTEAQQKEILKVDIKDGLKERYWRNEEIRESVRKYNAYIDSTLSQLQSMGYDYKKTPIQIHTYLNRSQQDWLTEQVNDPQYYLDDEHQSAVTVVDSQSGIVLAQSGGRREEAYGINRATQNTRSSGSSTKPFISYGPAIEYFGYGSSSTFDSSNYVYPGTNIVARNYGGATYGNVTMSFALQISLNSPALRVLDEIVGSSRAKEFLSKNGLDVKETYAGSDALGINVSTAQEAAAYAAIANGGVYRKPLYIKSLTFSDGSTKDIQIEETRSMKQSTAYILAKMLETTMYPNSSATYAKIDEFAGHLAKTGTVGYDVNDGIWRPDLASSDKWISGATKSISVSIWTGYDTPNEPGHWLLDNDKGYMYLYTSIMRHFNSGKDTSAFVRPESVSGSGLSLFPVDTQIVNINERPITPENIDSSLYNELLSKNVSIKIEQSENVKKVPNDYKYQEWISKLSDEDKKLYDKWITNRNVKPELSDILDVSTLYDNSTE